MRWRQRSLFAIPVRELCEFVQAPVIVQSAALIPVSILQSFDIAHLKVYEWFIGTGGEIS